MTRYFVTLVLATVMLWGSGCDAGVSSMQEADTTGVRTVLRAQVHHAAQAGKTSGRLTLDEAKLLVKTVQFNRVEDDGEADFKSESFVVRLDLSGQAQTVAVGAVPEGVYKRLTFKIHKPEDDEAVPDPDFREGPSGKQRFSVIVRGSIDGAPFVLKVNDSFRQRLTLAPPLVVSADAPEVAVTLFADVERWFVGPRGSLLDPRLEDDADAIADNIQDSFGALGHEASAQANDANDANDDGDDEDDEENDDDNDDDDEDEDGEDDGEDEDEDEEDEDEDEEDDEGEEQEMRGTVEQVGADFLVVSGTRFEVDEDTEFDGVDGLNALTVGMEVEVEFVERADGSLLALEVELEDEDEDD